MCFWLYREIFFVFVSFLCIFAMIINKQLSFKYQNMKRLIKVLNVIIAVEMILTIGCTKVQENSGGNNNGGGGNGGGPGQGKEADAGD